MHSNHFQFRHVLFFFFFTDTATTEIYTLSLHDALPISRRIVVAPSWRCAPSVPLPWRSEEHTSELQSRVDLVCRLLLEKKKRPRRTSDPARPQNRTLVAQWSKAYC